MATVWLIVALVVALGLWLGWRRAMARAWVALFPGLALLLVSAGGCYLIGQGKTGGFLAGIVGTLLSILLLILAGALASGAAAGWVNLRLRAASRLPDRSQPPSTTTTQPPDASVRSWDMWLLGLIALAALLLSLAE